MALSLTVVPSDSRLSKPLVEYCCTLISQKLEEDDVRFSLRKHACLDPDPRQSSLTAAYCCKTIVLASTAPQSNPALKHCLRFLIPGIIRFMSSAAADGGDDQTFSENKRQGLEEVTKAFSTFFGIVPTEHKSRMLGILLPTYLLLLSTEDVAPQHIIGVQSLLQVASSAPQAFKDATGKLEQQQKTLLENTLREALAGGSGNANSKAANQW